MEELQCRITKKSCETKIYKRTNLSVITSALHHAIYETQRKLTEAGDRETLQIFFVFKQSDLKMFSVCTHLFFQNYSDPFTMASTHQYFFPYCCETEILSWSSCAWRQSYVLLRVKSFPFQPWAQLPTGYTVKERIGNSNTLFWLEGINLGNCEVLEHTEISVPPFMNEKPYYQSTFGFCR